MQHSGVALRANLGAIHAAFLECRHLDHSHFGMLLFAHAEVVGVFRQTAGNEKPGLEVGVARAVLNKTGTHL